MCVIYMPLMLQSVLIAIGHVLDKWALLLLAFHFLMYRLVLQFHTSLVPSFIIVDTNRNRSNYQSRTSFKSYANYVLAAYQALLV